MTITKKSIFRPNPLAAYGLTKESAFSKLSLSDEITVDGNDLLLTYNDGDLKSTVKLTLDGNKLVLAGKDGKTINEVVLPDDDTILSSANYDQDSKEIVLVFKTKDGQETPMRINVADLVDEYTAGNGLKLDEKEFAIDEEIVATVESVEAIKTELEGKIEEKVDASTYNEEKATFETTVHAEETYQPKGDYLTEHQDLSEYAKTADVEEKLDEKQDKGDYVEYSDYQGRKTIQLKNYDSISGVKTTGEGVNIAMVSKWDCVDIGSTQIPLILNGSKDRPTYNDTKEIALVEDLNGLAKSEDVTTEIENAVSVKANAADVYTKAEADDKFITEHQDLSEYAKTEDVDEKISDMLTKTEASETYQPKGEYLTEHQDLSEYAKTEDVDSKLEGKQDKGNYVAWGDYQGRKIIQLENRDAISGKISNGGGANLLMLSAYDGLDFDVTEVGSTQTALVLNTIEGVVKVEGPNKEQKTIATIDQIPSVEGLATESYVDGKASEVEAKIPSLEGYVKEEKLNDYAPKSEYDQTHANVETLMDEVAELEADKIDELRNTNGLKINKLDVGEGEKNRVVEIGVDEDKVVTWTQYSGQEGRRILKLAHRDPIAGASPKGGSQIAMVSDYDGLDYPVVELGGQKAAMVLNTCEDRVKVEVVEDNNRVQHSIATLDDLKDFPKYEPYVNGDINKKTIVLENDDNISGKRTDGLGVNLVEVSRWNVADFSSKSVHTNLNGMYERPTYNDREGIALLSDIEKVKSEMKSYVDALLKNYTLKSDEDIAKIVKAGGDVVLPKDIKAESGYTLTKNANIDLNGHALDAVSNGNYGDNIIIGNGANIVLRNGVIKEADNASEANASAVILIKTTAATQVTLENIEATGSRPVYLNNSNENTTVTIKGGKYTCDGENGEAIYVQKGGQVVIESGRFENPNATTYKGFLLNIKDDFRQTLNDPREAILVKGGTFVNFDPSNNASEGEGTSYVADGYHVEEKVIDENTTEYTVVKDSE